MLKRIWESRLISNYGAILVLIGLCTYYSIATIKTQHPISEESGIELAREIAAAATEATRVAIIVRGSEQDRRFAIATDQALADAGVPTLPVVAGEPIDARRALQAYGESSTVPSVIVTTEPASIWGPLKASSLQAMAGDFPAFAETTVRTPASYTWSSFLTRENLLNIVKQNADIAIIAIGMTLVIITGGIDLSVGSVLALSAVVTAVSIQSLAGGASAGPIGMIGAGLIGILLCVLCGIFNGIVVTWFRVPAFVVTLGMMMVARGVALIVAVRYQSALLGGGTRGTPEAVKIEATGFGALGYEATLGIPNPVLLMLALYLLFHFLMKRTSIGRYIYAVGGNPEAARLSGVPVKATLILVYAICAGMAGLGGILDASRFVGGRPAAGDLYELQVIAAVVVGGTSLSGGQGSVMGTLVGVLIIAVIQNGLNMALVESYEQKVVFGALILAAVLIDQLKKHRTD